MILLLIYWTYVTALLLIYGVLFEQILHSIFFPKRQFQKTPPFHIAYTFLSGMVLITILGTWFSLIFRLNIEINVMLGIGGIFGFLRQKEHIFSRTRRLYQEIRETPILLKCIFGLAVFMASSGSCIDSIWNFDHGMYYVQYVKWLENYAVVPGLGNLWGQFGYNSTWHILTAIFSFSFLGEDLKFNDLNGLFWLFLVMRSLYGLHYILQKKGRLSDYFTVFMPLPIYIMRYYFNAAFADFAIICLIFLLLTLTIENIENQTWGKVDLPNILLGIFCFFTVTVKLSAAPIMCLIFVLIGYLILQKELIAISKASGIILLLVVPWLIRYYILSGFLVFPFHQIDWFNPDWKVDTGISHYFQKEIEARSKIRNFQYEIEEVIRLPYEEWLPQWFDHMKYYEQFLVVIFATSWGTFTLLFLYQILKNKNLSRNFILIFGTLWAGLLFWFLKAPDPRFGYAWLFASMFFANAFILKNLLSNIEQIPLILSIILSLWAVKVSYDSLNELYYFAGTRFEFREKFEIYYDKKQHQKVLDIIFGKTPKTCEVPMNQYQLGDITFYFPKYRDVHNKMLCWDAPLPCYAHDLTNYIELRGETLQDGFRLKRSSLSK